MSLEEGVRRMTSLAAQNLGLKKRGALREGFYADLAIFDPNIIEDHATFDQPHQYASGMVHVFVNGTHVLNLGNHTGLLPGRCLRGPGWNQKR
jgi:N-acyl-D-amino-acid deacylase